VTVHWPTFSSHHRTSQASQRVHSVASVRGACGLGTRAGDENRLQHAHAHNGASYVCILGMRLLAKFPVFFLVRISAFVFSPLLFPFLSFLPTGNCVFRHRVVIPDRITMRFRHLARLHYVVFYAVRIEFFLSLIFPRVSFLFPFHFQFIDYSRHLQNYSCCFSIAVSILARDGT